jgi:hypothetical protein
VTFVWGLRALVCGRPNLPLLVKIQIDNWVSSTSVLGPVGAAFLDTILRYRVDVH